MSSTSKVLLPEELASVTPIWWRSSVAAPPIQVALPAPSVSAPAPDPEDRERIEREAYQRGFAEGKTLGKEQATAHTIPGWRDMAAILVTFHCTLFAWILFRSQDLSQVGQVFKSIANNFDAQLFLRDALKLKFFIVILLALEWIQRRKVHPLEIGHLPVLARWSIYNIVVIAILWLGTFSYSPFIYFQF